MNSGGLQTEQPRVVINLTILWTQTEGWGWGKRGSGPSSSRTARLTGYSIHQLIQWPCEGSFNLRACISAGQTDKAGVAAIRRVMAGEGVGSAQRQRTTPWPATLLMSQEVFPYNL